jgi:hypothetical protein
VEWSIGEAVGLLVKYASGKKVTPRVVRERKELRWLGEGRYLIYDCF